MNKEKLSQLLDNELDVNETEAVLDALLDDPELQRAWLIQYTARTAIGENAVHPSLNIVDRVATALESEAPISAPENLNGSENTKSPEPVNTDIVVSLNAKRNRVMAYVAMAASLAALLIVNYYPGTSQGPDVADLEPPVPETQGMENEIQSMIVQHGEFSGAAALNGLVTYAKVVNGSSGNANR